MAGKLNQPPPPITDRMKRQIQFPDLHFRIRAQRPFNSGRIVTGQDYRDFANLEGRQKLLGVTQQGRDHEEDKEIIQFRRWSE